MKRLILITAIGLAFYTAGISSPPEVKSEPFEPPPHAFFHHSDKYAQPEQIVPYQMVWPAEKNRAASAQIGDVVVLVQIDSKGEPRKLAVLSTTDDLFTRSALASLQRTRWKEIGRDTWFYFRAHFDLGEAIDSAKR